MRVQYPVVECLVEIEGLQVWVSQVELHIVLEQSKEEGKGQESIQSSYTHDPGHSVGRLYRQKKTSHTREPRGQPLSNRWPQDCKKKIWQARHIISCLVPVQPSKSHPDMTWLKNIDWDKKNQIKQTTYHRQSFFQIWTLSLKKWQRSSQYGLYIGFCKCDFDVDSKVTSAI